MRIIIAPAKKNAAGIHAFDQLDGHFKPDLSSGNHNLFLKAAI